jgi:hypothetical protein
VARQLRGGQALEVVEGDPLPLGVPPLEEQIGPGHRSSPHPPPLRSLFSAVCVVCVCVCVCRVRVCVCVVCVCVCRVCVGVLQPWPTSSCFWAKRA